LSASEGLRACQYFSPTISPQEHYNNSWINAKAQKPANYNLVKKYPH